jgi:hypothetical protein
MMRWCVFHPCAAGQTVRALAAGSLDTYEAAASAAVELQWLVAHSAMYEPLGALVRAWADVSRDTIAVQLSRTRWLLDL